MIAPAPRTTAPAGPSRCEIATLTEAARALRMMDREVASLRQEILSQSNRSQAELASAHRAAWVAIALGGCGVTFALVALLVR